MRAPTNETKELTKKKTKKKANKQNLDDETGIVQNNLAHDDNESNHNFFCLLNDELKKCNDISVGYDDIFQRFLLKFHQSKTENVVLPTNFDINAIDYSKIITRKSIKRSAFL